MDNSVIKKLGQEYGWELVLEESEDKIVLGSAHHRARATISFLDDNKDLRGLIFTPDRLHSKIEAFTPDLFGMEHGYYCTEKRNLIRLLYYSAPLARRLRIKHAQSLPGATRTRRPKLNRAPLILLETEIMDELRSRGSKQFPPDTPLVKLFNPAGAGEWYPCYIREGIAYGFVDTEQGMKFGPIDLNELARTLIPVRLPNLVSGVIRLERCASWNPRDEWPKPFSIRRLLTPHQSTVTRSSIDLDLHLPRR